MSDTHTHIDSLVKGNDIVLFMKGNASFPMCGFSGRAIQILKAVGVDPKTLKTVNVLEDDEIRQGIKEYSQWPTIPQLYIKGEFIGGADIVRQLHASGELKQKLGDLAASPTPPTVCDALPVSFFAQPSGKPASEFPMVLRSEESVEFANANHDYPQRIRYWRQGQLLMAEISKIDGSDAQQQVGGTGCVDGAAPYANTLDYAYTPGAGGPGANPIYLAQWTASAIGEELTTATCDALRLHLEVKAAP